MMATAETDEPNLELGLTSPTETGTILDNVIETVFPTNAADRLVDEHPLNTKVQSIESRVETVETKVNEVSDKMCELSDRTPTPPVEKPADALPREPTPPPSKDRVQNLVDEMNKYL